MRVRCRTNSAADLTTPWRVGLGDGCYPYLTPGREYVVYALEWGSDGAPGYVLCDDHYWLYPLAYPAELFDIIDPRPSQYWVVGFVPRRALGTSGRVVPPHFAVGFREWVDEVGFQYWITESSEPHVSTWRRYKGLIDAEAQAVGSEDASSS